MFIFPHKIRFTNPDKLIKAFGFDLKKIDDKKKKKLIHELQTEFHTRFHSHAPENLINHVSNRNTIWYITNCSGIAMILGVAISSIIICKIDVFSFNLWFILSLVVFLALAISSSYNGCKWNKEFWSVGYKWITWDLKIRPDHEYSVNYDFIISLFLKLSN